MAKRVCHRCGVEFFHDWGRSTSCPECAAHPEPTYKRCSRCGLHQPWPKPGWGSTHCPPCHRLDAKESRARRKERLKDAPPPPLEMRICTQCGVAHEWPTPGWRDRTCPPCTRQYQRGYKLTHGPKLAPDVLVYQAAFKKCSHCRQRSPYHPTKGWKGNICGSCHAGFQRIARANRKAQVAEWRENQTPVRCRTCLETSPYGVGWDWTQCPSCVSARAKASYAKVRENPERLAHRRAMQAAAEVKRALKRNQKSRESPPGPDSSPSSPAGDGWEAARAGKGRERRLGWLTGAGLA